MNASTSPALVRVVAPNAAVVSKLPTMKTLPTGFAVMARATSLPGPPNCINHCITPLLAYFAKKMSEPPAVVKEDTPNVVVFVNVPIA